MFPEFSIGMYTVHTYGLMAAIGLIAAILVLGHLAPKRGLNPYEFVGSLAWAAPLTIVCASALYGLTNAAAIASIMASAGQYASPLDVVQAIAVQFGGMVFYGGLLGAIAGVLIWLKRTGRSKEDYLDLVAVAIPLFHAFARIGCFLGGCCFGVESPIGFMYTVDPIAEANGVVRFPVQLLESACEALLFIVMLRLFNSEKLKGQLIWVWLGSYAVVRFFDEFLRGDAYRGFLGPLSTSQWISLMIGVAVIVHVIRRRNAKAGTVAANGKQSAARMA